MKVRNIMMGAMLFAFSYAQAQDTYLNDRVTATDDLNGSARYVGMGGALGALGADLSVISDNPAGIGLYRKSDVGLTFGCVVPNGNGWDKNDPTTYGERLARASFDQIGLVWSLNTGGKLKFVNFGFNYQKKANYNQGFFADNGNLCGLSQMDQIAELATGDANGSFATDNNLAGLTSVPVADDETMDDYYLKKDAEGYYNEYSSYSNAYTRHQRGSLQEFAFNTAFNVQDRFYTGLTIGVDNVNYKSWSEYGEWGADGGLNHTLYNDREISGYGVNLKIGFIVRPIEESSLRVGLTAETPTWYRLKNSTLFNLDKSDQIESYLEYNVRTPWKCRLSAGSTVDKFLAWGVEYEYANYGMTTQGYPLWDINDPNHSGLRSERDFAMNQFTKSVLRGQHTIKAGVEVKPCDAFAFRVGYNFVSSRYKDGANFDQYTIDSPAMNYSTSTDYMTLGAANIVTFGVGYKYKRFYADLTYKFRAQTGKFYAFDTTGMTQGIAPVDVNLNKNQVMLGLGFKF